MYLREVLLQSRATDNSIYARQGGPGDISLDKSELVAIFIEAMIYGVEALTFVATVYLLHGARRNRALLLKFSVVIIMFLLNTIHIGTSLRRLLNAFIGAPGAPSPDPAGYLSDLAGFLYRFRNILVVIQTIILDILVAYRCYMVWDRKIWVALVPSPSIIAYLATGIIAIRAFAVYRNDIFTGNTKIWVSATLCITLLTKLVCLAIVSLGTLLPRPKSVWHSSYLKVNRHARLYKIVLIGIESGGLAVLGTLILVPVYLSGRNAQGILWGAMSPLTGQSLLLIITASLLGLTPSTGGASRRRKGAIPNTRVTIPPIAVSPITSPVSRFSVPGTLFKSTSPSSVSPSTPSDFSSKSKLPFSDPEVKYPNSRYSRGSYTRDEMPFSTAIATLEDTPRVDFVRGTPAYGDGEVARKDRSGFNSRRNSGEATPRNTFHVARSADGGVEVFQKEHSAS